ncbi:MAG: ricin-type beta-trefoil lectin domain protein [Polyangiales bacterium]
MAGFDGAVCLDADGGKPRVWRCNGTVAQRWSVARDDTLRQGALCLTVTVDKPVEGSPLTVAACSGESTQQFLALGDELVHSPSGLCVDALEKQSRDGTPLQLWSCSGNTNQRWRLPVGQLATAPLLGSRVFVFEPALPPALIQRRASAVFARQVGNQFGPQRFALLFAPGEYDVDVNVGFYTQVAGLGLSPDDVTIRGAVHVEADWFPDHSQNATQNFWRVAENLAVVPKEGFDRWAVSQAAPYRRVHLAGDLVLDDGGWASGGFLADSWIEGEVRPGSQQQWFSRSSQWRQWVGANWNMVFAGVLGAPENTFPNPPHTNLPTVPKIREKPFLHRAADGGYHVFVPALRENSQGATWREGAAPGELLPLERFVIAQPGDSAATLNVALAAGKNLLLLPGIYVVDEPLHVTEPDTVVLGLGLATVTPHSGSAAITVDDVDGVKIAGLTVDAGPVSSPVLMTLGETGKQTPHASNPSSLHDVFFRVGGGATNGRTQLALQVASNDVLGDDVWIWRADHGAPASVGWEVNTADTGLIVDGDDVSMYGLFVEHFQKQQTIWRGQRGRTYFYQSELPYDVPSQAAWMNGAARGFAAYQLAESVTAHEAWGMGAYCFFNVDSGVVLDRAFEAPSGIPGVQLHHLLTVSLGGIGTIEHVLNDLGDRVSAERSGPAFVTAGPTP